MTYHLIMRCKNKHEEDVCWWEGEQKLETIAGFSVNVLRCSECSAAFNEWWVEVRYGS